MSNNYPPGCCKKLISKHKGHFDFQKAELCFPFESTAPTTAKRSLCFLMTILSTIPESCPFYYLKDVCSLNISLGHTKITKIILSLGSKSTEVKGQRDASCYNSHSEVEEASMCCDSYKNVKSLGLP